MCHKAHLPRGCIPHFEMCFELSLVGPQTAERESTLFPNTSLRPLAEAYHSTVETSHAQHNICPACPPPNPSHPLPQMVVTFRAPQQIWREEGKGGGGEAKENNIQRILKFLFLPSFSACAFVSANMTMTYVAVGSISSARKFLVDQHGILSLCFMPN